MKRDGHREGAEICGRVEKEEGKAARFPPGEQRGGQSRKVDAALRGYTIFEAKPTEGKLKEPVRAQVKPSPQ